MTDDLVKRLRKVDEYEPLGHDGWEAADRIEELVKERDKFEALALMKLQENGTHIRRAEAAEAKLAKAVEALEEIITRWDTPSWKDAEATGNVINRARTNFAAYPPKPLTQFMRK